MKISDLKAGDFFYYKNNCGCEYVSIVKETVEVDNDKAVVELVCVCYNDPTEDEAGFIWYGTSVYIDENSLRLATEEEKKYLLEIVNEDGNYYDEKANAIYSLIDKEKKHTFKIHRVIELKSYYEDDIEIEADNLQNALNKAEMMNADEYKVLEKINVCDDCDINRIELTSEDGEDYREVIF